MISLNIPPGKSIKNYIWKLISNLSLNTTQNEQYIYTNSYANNYVSLSYNLNFEGSMRRFRTLSFYGWLLNE